MDNLTSLINNLSIPDDKTKNYSNTILSNYAEKKLLPYQKKHTINLINKLLEKNIALDSSDTGIGKTYVASAVCYELKRKPIIICPKTLIFNWISILQYYGVQYYDIVNYETIKNGKSYRDNKFKSRIKARYLDILDIVLTKSNPTPYQWNVPSDTIVIFDEVHRCNYPSSGNGKLLLSVKQLISKKIPVLMLSATICEKISDMKIPFYLFDLIPTTSTFNKYTRNISKKYSHHSSNATKDNCRAIAIYEEIKPFTNRLKISDLGDIFPSNQICCQQFYAAEYDEIIQSYEKMASIINQLKEKPEKHHLVTIQKLKQEIELKKIPIFVEQSNIYMDEGKSVVILVNYLDTMNLLIDVLDIKCKIYGGQTIEERQKSINLFQSNKEFIIICQIRAGGVGISLHDIHGNHPRVSLINFPDSATDLIQALGRIHRSGAKTPALQRIIFVANVDYEMQIMQNINNKLTNLSAITDGDFAGYKILKKN